MIKSIINTRLYKELDLKAKFHAYLFYSQDRVKNNEISLAFAKSLVCEHKNACDFCAGCRQFEAGSHPDVFVLEQDSIKVDDVKLLLEKMATKPIQASKKVFVVLNAETINEISQNKLLKSLEEPNDSAIFILTTTQTSKLLPTVLSRLNKIFVPNFCEEDEIYLAEQLKKDGIDIGGYINKGFSLTDMINFAGNGEYLQCTQEIRQMFLNLNTSADIPSVVSALNVGNKQLFFNILQEIWLSALNGGNKFDEDIVAPIKLKFNEKAMLKCLPLIDEAYKKFMANVNFGYILDNLLFCFLKERFLCK